MGWQYHNIADPKTRKRIDEALRAAEGQGKPPTEPRDASSAAPRRPNPRIRQRTKPLSNKLEAEFGRMLRHKHPFDYIPIFEQAITFRLANGVRYTPDWVMVSAGKIYCYEVKGKHSWDDAIVKIKMAAAVYSSEYFVWILADKPDSDGLWREQWVLP